MMGTTNGFMGGYPFSRHYISCAPIANGLTKKSGMQRDDWYSSSRVPKELESRLRLENMLRSGHFLV